MLKLKLPVDDMRPLCTGTPAQELADIEIRCSLVMEDIDMTLLGWAEVPSLGQLSVYKKVP